MFDEYAFPNQATESTLADVIWKHTEKVNSNAEVGETAHVIDEGGLLQRIPWKKGSLFDQICQESIRYIQNRYNHSTSVAVVFDAYLSGPSTKNVANLRRTKNQGPEVSFFGDTTCHLTKEVFLSNPKNKDSFIHLLGSHLT